MANHIGDPVSLDGWSHIYSGKVRDLYVPQDSRLHGSEVVLVVASDRISAYDHVLRPAIPDKGKILTALTLWWFEQLHGLVPNHVVSTDVPPEVEGRAMICRRLSMYPVECVVRGYLSGSGLKEYHATGAVCGVELPEGLIESAKLDEPIFTPAAKAEYGEHDENITFEQTVALVGEDRARRLRDRSVMLYKRAAEIAAGRGIILGDTKFEFGASKEAGGPEVVLGDEVLTPDSSRFWFAEDWQPGTTPKSLDKQFVRDWLASPESGWDPSGNDEPPALPLDVVDLTRARYVRAYEQLTGQAWE